MLSSRTKAPVFVTARRSCDLEHVIVMVTAIDYLLCRNYNIVF